MKTSKFNPRAASAITITRFDANGQVIEVETVAAEKKKSAYKHVGDVTYHLRVMAEQETGEEVFVGYAVDGEDAALVCETHLQEHPEHRRAWAEAM